MDIFDKHKELCLNLWDFFGTSLPEVYVDKS